MDKLRYLTDNVVHIWDSENAGKIEKLLVQKYGSLLIDEYFSVDSGSNRDQVQIKMVLLKRDGSVAYPIECVCPLVPERSESAEDLAFLMLDYLDVYWSEYLGDGRDTFLPIDWSRHECDGVVFFARGFVRNVALEREADRLFEEEGCGDHDIKPISSET